MQEKSKQKISEKQAKAWKEYTDEEYWARVDAIAEGLRRYQATLTPEQRRARAQKAAATRKLNQLKKAGKL